MSSGARYLYQTNEPAAPHICLLLADVGFDRRTTDIRHIQTEHYIPILPTVPRDLRRYQQSGQSHFVTFSCYHRQPCFSGAILRDTFLECLERTRRRYRLQMYGYVVMPEHVHLLVSEPEFETLSTALQALKVSFSRRTEINRFGYVPDGAPHLPSLGRCGIPLLPSSKPAKRPFWQKRYYDHNVRNYESFARKLDYIHHNPVKRGLCSSAIEWPWSSFRHYATAEIGVVEIESEWTAIRRTGREPRLLGVQVGAMGQPTSAK